jgi:hypothetical protein
MQTKILAFYTLFSLDLRFVSSSLFPSSTLASLKHRSVAVGNSSVASSSYPPLSSSLSTKPSSNSAQSSLSKVSSSATPPSITSKAGLVSNATSTCSGQFSFPTTGTGLPYASSCAELIDLIFFHTSKNTQFPCLTDVGIFDPYISTSVSVNTFISTINLYSTTKLCDGVPRAMGSPTSQITVQATISVPAWSLRSDKSVNFALKVIETPSLQSLLPPCTIGLKDCAALWQSFEGALASKFINNQLGDGVLPDFPFCDYKTRDCNKCTIFGGDVRLLYFPEPTTSRDLCAATPAANGKNSPRSVAANGETHGWTR